MFKKFIFLTLFATLLFARVVVDSDGKAVQVPDNVERASPMVGIFVQITVALGNEDKIISGAYRGLSPMMLKIFPKIKTTGFRGGSLGASVETLISTNTQVVFGPASVLVDDNMKKQLENAGIAVVRIDSKMGTAQDLKDRVMKIAEIFGDESIKRAKEFNAYYDENINFVRSNLPKNAYKKRVLVLNYRAGNWATTTTNFMPAEYIKLAGGEHLASQAGAFGYSPSINEEQIIVYNPDVIIVNSQEGLQAILQNASFKELKAVKNKQIFVQPRGAITFWAGTEGALQILWLAKILHPNEFKDLNLEQKVREFYERFYNYKLSDDELKEILNPKEKIQVIYWRHFCAFYGLTKAVLGAKVVMDSDGKW